MLASRLRWQHHARVAADLDRAHFHDLRHTHRTWMDEDNVPEVAQARRLGHQPPGIRGVYAHTTPTMTERLLAGLQQRWLNAGGHW